MATPLLRRVRIDIPDRGLSVTVREVTAMERIELSEGVADAEGDAKKTLLAMANFLALVLEDDQGQALFADDDAVLSTWPLAVVEQVFEAAARHNGFDAASQEAVRKNSEAAPDGPPTVSPSPLANGTLTACSPA